MGPGWAAAVGSPGAGSERAAIFFPVWGGRRARSASWGISRPYVPRVSRGEGRLRHFVSVVRKGRVRRGKGGSLEPLGRAVERARERLWRCASHPLGGPCGLQFKC